MGSRAVDTDKLKKENQMLKEELKKTQKEKKQVEKALREMSALYALKKKAAEYWGEKEDD